MNFIFSNWPIEDDHAEAIFRSPSGSPWHFWTVIDGHVGWETSAALAERLIPSVNRALQGLYTRQENPSSEAIDSAIKDTFVSLDNDFVYKSVEKALDGDSRKEAAVQCGPPPSPGLTAPADARPDYSGSMCPGTESPLSGQGLARAVYSTG